MCQLSFFLGGFDCAHKRFGLFEQLLRFFGAFPQSGVKFATECTHVIIVSIKIVRIVFELLLGIQGWFLDWKRFLSRRQFLGRKRFLDGRQFQQFPN